MNIEENWSDWETHRDDGSNKVATVAVGMKTRSQRKFHVFRCEVGSLNSHEFCVSSEAEVSLKSFPWIYGRSELSLGISRPTKVLSESIREISDESKQ